MTLYSYSVYDQVRPDGVGVFLMRGDLVPVGDARYVQMPHSGTLMPQDETWTACRHEAKRRAAAQVQQMAETLAAQAKRLMAEADAEQSAEANANG